MKRWFWVVFFLVVGAMGVRFWQLEMSPASLYIDEIDLGYQASSLLTTGRDYRGGSGLVVVRSFNADRLPMSVWGAMLSTKIFDDPFYQVRGGGALAGVMVVVMAGLLMWVWSRKPVMVICAVAVFAFSPWMIQFSRIGFEGMYEVLMLAMAFLGWQIYLRRKRWWYLMCVLGLGLSLYTYRSMSLLFPLLIVSLVLVYWREVLLLGWYKVGVGMLLLTVLAVPHYWLTVFRPSDELRISQISVWSDPMVPIQVMRNRELASGDYMSGELGRSPVWWSRIVYNKGVAYAKAVVDNYLTAWSSGFLFVSGDPNLRHNPSGGGMLFRLDVLGLAAGLWYLARHWRKRFVRFLSLVLVLAPFGSVVTEGGGTHAHRLLVFGFCLLLVVSLGWSWLIGRWRGWVWVFGVGYVIMAGFYLVKYQVRYPFESARAFGYGYRQAMEEVKRLEDDFVEVRMTQSIDPPIFYYLFWNKVDPGLVIEHGSDFSGNKKGGVLNKYRAFDWERGRLFAAESLEKDVLYLLTQGDIGLDLRDSKALPKDIVLWKVVLYPDGTPAFYLVSRT